VQTTERYLGCKQNPGHPVNDLFELRIDTPADEDGAESDGPEPSPRLETSQKKIGRQRDDSEYERASVGGGTQRRQITELDTGT